MYQKVLVVEGKNFVLKKTSKLCNHKNKLLKYEIYLKSSSSVDVTAFFGISLFAAILTGFSTDELGLE